MRTVVGVFPSRAEADHVARDLNSVGIPREEVTITNGARSDEGEWSNRNIAATAGSGFGWFLAGLIPKIAERPRPAAIGFGAMVGAGAGLILGLIIDTARSGRAPIVTGNPVVTVLVAIVVGAVCGGIVAGIYSTGVSHEVNPLSEEALREHGVVVSVHVDEPTEEEALRLMKQHGARALRAGADAWAASGSKAEHGDEEPYPSDSAVRSRPYKDY